jgi:hypothetical protein
MALADRLCKGLLNGVTCGLDISSDRCRSARKRCEAVAIHRFDLVEVCALHIRTTHGEPTFFTRSG